jgi:hypothetical protein
MLCREIPPSHSLSGPGTGHFVIPTSWVGWLLFTERLNSLADLWSEWVLPRGSEDNVLSLSPKGTLTLLFLKIKARTCDSDTSSGTRLADHTPHALKIWLLQPRVLRSYLISFHTLGISNSLCSFCLPLASQHLWFMNIHEVASECKG